MTTNPLNGRSGSGGGKVTVDMLRQLAEDLNRMRWVSDSGLPYFVNRRFDGEEYVHYLDRRTHATPPTGQAR